LREPKRPRGMRQGHRLGDEQYPWPARWTDVRHGDGYRNHWARCNTDFSEGISIGWQQRDDCALTVRRFAIDATLR